MRRLFELSRADETAALKRETAALKRMTARRAWRRALWRVSPLLLLLGGLTQTSCVLITDQAYTRRVYRDNTCRATLVDTATGEARMISSRDPSLNPAPARSFVAADYDMNGARDANDVLLDWQRFIAGRVVTSGTYAGRSWCIRPAETSCAENGGRAYGLGSGDLPPLPDGAVPECGPLTPPPPPPGPRLEVIAPALDPAGGFSFPDTPVGISDAPVIFVVANTGGVPVRVNSTDLLGGMDAPDFIKTADNCQPTAIEMSAGLGRLLNMSETCTFNLQFAPRYRPGAGECDRDAPNESCRRRVALSITGEVAADRTSLTPFSLSVSGRAIGGRLDAPTEVCFSTLTPAIGSCTETRTLRIGNAGGRATTGDLTLTFARLTRPGNTFSAPPPFLMGAFTLQPGLSSDVMVSFCNTANDPTDGVYTINSSAPRDPTHVVTLVNPLNRTCP